MHTALVSRILRDRSLWEETTTVEVKQHVPIMASAAALSL